MNRREVQLKAEEHVLIIERDNNPEKVKKLGFDIRSGDKQIEVKGRTGKDHIIQLNYKNIEALKREPNFWLYIVHFDKIDEKLLNPKVTKLNKEAIEKRAKKRKQWEVSFLKSDK